MLEFVLDLIFPNFCVGCHKLGTLLCASCATKINFYPFPLIPELDQNYLENITVMAEYADVTKQLVTTLKYQSVKKIGTLLGEMIYNTTPFPLVDVITSVPLHPKRQWQRGFNQAEEIALALSQRTQVPYRVLLKRIKHSQPQAQITQQEKRLSRLSQNFALNYPPVGKHFQTALIVDDVVTTGATLNECVRVLKQAEINQVYGLAVAHGQ